MASPLNILIIESDTLILVHDLALLLYSVRLKSCDVDNALPSIPVTIE